MSGLEGPSSSALFQHSFPQPDELETEEEEGGQGTRQKQNEASGADGAAAATVDTPPSLEIPKGSEQKEDVVLDAESDAYVDAPSEPEDIHDDDEQGDAESDADKGPGPRRSSTKSFVTASSVPTKTADDNEPEEAAPNRVSQPQEEQQPGTSGSNDTTNQEVAGQKALGKRPVSTAVSQGSPSSLDRGGSVDANSTSSLLHKTDVNKAAPAVVDPSPPPKGILARVKRRSEMRSSTPPQLDEADPGAEDLSRRKSNLRNLVKFDIPEDSRRATIHLKAKKAQMTVQRAGTKIRRQKIKDGIVVKMERMLVRVDAAGEVPDEFDENVNQRVISRVKDKWREYMIVCRHSHKDDAEFVLQFYQTRVSSPSAYQHQARR